MIHKCKACGKEYDTDKVRIHEAITYMVGCPSCKTCPFFVKEFVKDGVRYIHCDHIKAHQS